MKPLISAWTHKNTPKHTQNTAISSFSKCALASPNRKKSPTLTRLTSKTDPTAHALEGTDITFRAHSSAKPTVTDRNIHTATGTLATEPRIGTCSPRPQTSASSPYYNTQLTPNPQGSCELYHSLPQMPANLYIATYSNVRTHRSPLPLFITNTPTTLG